MKRNVFCRHGCIGATALARVFAIALGIAAANNAWAAQWYVTSGGAGLDFSPQFLTIRAGDSVTFLNLGGFHNVVADDGSFRCAHGCDGDGSGGSGNASAELWFATVTFPAAGTFGYFCEPHGAPGSGMYGTIEVLASPKPVTPAPGSGALGDLLLGTGLIMGVALRLRRLQSRAYPEPLANQCKRSAMVR